MHRFLRNFAFKDSACFAPLAAAPSSKWKGCNLTWGNHMELWCKLLKDPVQDFKGFYLRSFDNRDYDFQFQFKSKQHRHISNFYLTWLRNEVPNYRHDAVVSWTRTRCAPLRMSGGWRRLWRFRTFGRECYVESWEDCGKTCTASLNNQMVGND